MPKIYEGIYRHYEGDIYRVICVAEHTQTLEDLVVYEDVSDDKEKKWALPASMWEEKVSVDGEPVPRYQYLARSLSELDEKPVFKLIEDIVEHMEMYDRMSEDNDIAYYEKATGDVITVSRGVMSGYEEDEDISEYPPEMIRDAERISNSSPGDLVQLPDGDSVDEYDLMESFSNEVPIRFQAELLRAIQGKGAFRRFKDTAARLKLLNDWYEYKKAGFRKEAREWCDYMELPWSKVLLKRDTN